MAVNPKWAMAVFEAFKFRWTQVGLDVLVPNGVFWGEAPEATLMPFVIFDPVTNLTVGRSNKSRYWNHVFGLKVYHTAPDYAGYLLAQVEEALDAPLLTLSPEPAEGYAINLEFDNEHYIKEDEGVWYAEVQCTVVRIRPRKTHATQT